MKRSLLGLAFTFICLVAASASAQDFHKSYTLGAGGQIKIGNISGDVIVTGYAGETVLVTATKTGRDSDQVDVEDLSSGNRIDIRVRYPKRCNCDVDVKFQVQVPNSMNYDFESISSVSGAVEVNSVRGTIRASSVSGEVRVKDVAGSVNASSVSGSVDVEIRQLSGSEDMKFSSVSGSVNVRMPEGIDAEVRMSTLSGGLRTDFPIEIKKKERYSPGTSASGRLGNGSRSLSLSSVSGSVNLTRM